jgi:ceramide glucosyltransferase
VAATVFFIFLIALPSLVILLFPLWIARSRRMDEALRSSEAAPVSIDVVIPLACTEENLEEHVHACLVQTHPAPVLAVFVAERPEHPSARCVARITREGVPVPARLVFSGDPGAAVAKMHNLIRAAEECRHDSVVLLDSDVLLSRPDHLSLVTAPLHDASVGLVTAAPWYHHPRTIGGYLQATMINADVWGYFASLQAVGSLNVANGAILAMRRETLRAIGDLHDMRHKVLNDTAIARAVRALGKSIHLSAEPAHISTPSTSIADWWHQAMRWHVGMRRVLPRIEFVLFGLLRFPTLAGVIGYFVFVDSPLRFFIPLLPVAARCISFALIADLWKREAAVFLQLLLAPLTDLLSPVLWILAWFGNTISWRGRRYRVEKDGIAHARS